MVLTFFCVLVSLILIRCSYGNRRGCYWSSFLVDKIGRRKQDFVVELYNNRQKMVGGSARLTRVRQNQTLEQKAQPFLDKCDPDYVMEEFYPEKERGVKAVQNIKGGTFLAQYCGELLTGQEGEEREEKGPGSVFRFFFYHKGRSYCIDATTEPLSGPSLGRLANDSRKNFNAKMKVLEIDNRVYLGLFATRDICPEEEILYDYGIKNRPWEIQKSGSRSKAKKTNTQRDKAILPTQEFDVGQNSASKTGNSEDSAGSTKPLEEENGDSETEGHEAFFAAPTMSCDLEDFASNAAEEEGVDDKTESEEKSTISQGQDATQVFETVPISPGSPAKTSKNMSPVKSQTSKTLEQTMVLPSDECADTDNDGEETESESDKLKVKPSALIDPTLDLNDGTTRPIEEEEEICDKLKSHESSKLEDNVTKDDPTQVFVSDDVAVEADIVEADAETLMIGAGWTLSEAETDVSEKAVEPNTVVINTGETQKIVKENADASEEGVSQDDATLAIVDLQTEDVAKSRQSTRKARRTEIEATQVYGDETDGEDQKPAKSRCSTRSEILMEATQAYGHADSDEGKKPAYEDDDEKKLRKSGRSPRKADEGVMEAMQAYGNEETDEGKTPVKSKQITVTCEDILVEETQGYGDDETDEEIKADVLKQSTRSEQIFMEVTEAYGEEETDEEKNPARSSPNPRKREEVPKEASQAYGNKTTEGEKKPLKARRSPRKGSGSPEDVAGALSEEEKATSKNFKRVSLEDLTFCGLFKESFSVDNCPDCSTFHQKPHIQVFEDDEVEDSCDSTVSDIYPDFGASLRPSTSSNSAEPQVVPKQKVKDVGSRVEPLVSDNQPTVVPKQKVKDVGSRVEPLVSDNQPTGEVQRKITAYPDVYIPIYKKKESGGRCYDKRHSCYFCSQLVSKMSRHLKNVHSQNIEVAKVIALKSPEKVEFELERLRLLGNFKHNLQVLKEARGELIVKRRSLHRKTAEDYLPCIYCYAFIEIGEIWRHVSICEYNEGCEEVDEDSLCDNGHGVSITTRCRMLLAGASSPSTAKLKFSDLENVVIQKMRSGPEKEIIENDPLILLFGSALLEKGGSSKRHLISTRMRQLARLLLQMRAKDPSLNLKDCLCGQRFDDVIFATKEICGNPQALSMNGVQLMKTPSLGLQIGHSLAKVIEIKRGQAVRNQDNKDREDVAAFRELFEAEWTDKISSRALSTLKERQYNKEALLPLTSDICRVTQFASVSIQKYIKKLTAKRNKLDWHHLSKSVFVALTLFNKRRGGEVARMRLTSYTKRMKWAEVQNQELINSLNSMERKLLERYDMLQLPGKRNRRVPMILKPEVVVAMDLLVSSRDQCGIKTSYFFAIPEKHSHISAWKVMREFAVEAKCEKPMLISSTNLRKYTATVTQVLSLSQGELEWLSNHLGHQVDIHKEVYRQHESTVELTKVAKILLAVEKGGVSRFSGKSLSDIEIDDIDISVGSDTEGEDGPEKEVFTKPESSKKRKPLVHNSSESDHESSDTEVFTKPESSKKRKPLVHNSSESDHESSDTEDILPKRKKRRHRVPVIEDSSDEENVVGDQKVLQKRKRRSQAPLIKASPGESDSDDMDCKVRRIPWADEDIELLKKKFPNFNAVYPSGQQIQRFLKGNPHLGRTPAQVKSKLQHLSE